MIIAFQQTIHLCQEGYVTYVFAASLNYCDKWLYILLLEATSQLACLPFGLMAEA